MASNNVHLKSGVGRRLFLAFFVVSMFSALSALLGWVGLTIIRSAQEDAFEQVYSAARNAQLVAVDATALILRLPDLFDAETIEELEAESNALTRREESILSLFARIENYPHSLEVSTKIKSLIENLAHDLNSVTSLLQETILLDFEIKQQMQRLLELSRKLVDQSRTALLEVSEETIIESNRISRTLDEANNRKPSSVETGTAFQNFVATHLVNLDRVGELQSRSESIRDSLLSLNDAASLERVAQLQQSIILNVRSITDSVARMPEGETKSRFIDLLSSTSEAVYRQNSLFSMTEEGINNKSQIEELRLTAEQKGQLISQIAGEFVSSTEKLLQRRGEYAQQASYFTQFGQFVFAVFSISISAFIYLFYINNNVIRRIVNLSTSIEKLNSGQWAEKVPIQGDDEISDLANAVEGSRLNLIKLQETEQNLKTHARELERSNSDLEQFAYVTSHDLRAPLRGLENLSQWVEEDIESGNFSDVRNNMTRLRGRVQRMDALLRGLLLYARAGHEDSEPEEIKLTEYATRIFEDLKPEKKFDFSVASDSSTLVESSVFLNQVLNNLISNSIKHNDKDTGVIAVDFVISDDNCTLSVCDNGPGIPADMKERVFVMFQTLKPRDEVEASGIGLALVKRIVDRRQGAITVQDSPHGGACFIVTWPR